MNLLPGRAGASAVWSRPSWQAVANRAAIGQGARTAVVAFGGFAVGYWGFGQLQVAVFATFGGLALTGIANFGGTKPGRFVANLFATAAGPSWPCWGPGCRLSPCGPR